MKNFKKVLSTIMIIMIIFSTMAISAFAESNLAIPSNLQITTASDSVTLNWDAVPGATKYYIAEVGIQCFTVYAPATSYTVTGLQPGETYSFRVMSADNQSNSDWCDPVTVTTLQVIPAIPANLQATATTDSVTLTWDAVPGATKYYIAEVGIQSFVVNAPATSLTVTGLVPGTTYSFKVASINDLGNSEWCDPVTVTIPLTTPQTPLTAPANLQATATTDSVTLTWDAVPGATKYYIAEVGIQSFDVNAPDTSLTVTGLEPGTTYSFKVASINDQGNSEWCDPVSVTP